MNERVVGLLFFLEERTINAKDRLFHHRCPSSLHFMPTVCFVHLDCFRYGFCCYWRTMRCGGAKKTLRIYASCWAGKYELTVPVDKKIVDFDYIYIMRRLKYVYIQFQRSFTKSVKLAMRFCGAYILAFFIYDRGPSTIVNNTLAANLLSSCTHTENNLRLINE